LTVFLFERPVRFEEVDAAGIVFFGCFAGYAHEAMEAFFGELEGGYPRLILDRKVGLPAVKVEMSFVTPLRYGDVLVIETSTHRLGNKSAELCYRMRLRDGTSIAEVKHTVVSTDLAAMRSCDMPADVRATLARHVST
jgi:4-hydroxybenzoyl-CoA thioesterase